MTRARAPRGPGATTPPRIWTIGHSTLPIEAFLERLAAHRVETVADVRRHPASRWQPHFNRARLAASLEAGGLEYVHFEPLGGRREPAPGDTNAGLRDPQFRGYADWTATPEFAAALEQLTALAAARRTAMMCAEAEFTRCHRSLLADLLAARGWEVLHIEGTGPPLPHPMTPGARIEGGRVTYPAPFF
jgi:uncharacterized protein (DUF488 family)